jgi:E3 ubiquitin-protein ligase RGLG
VAADLMAAKRDGLLCPVCMDARKGVAFGCGHMLCSTCAERVTVCSDCRSPVQSRLTLFF